ncbi:hypothetical protein Hanom_Chr05g00407751 [Helianthus anomalus]
MDNSILNASELDTAVAALIDASRAVVHRKEFDVSHCSVTDQADVPLACAEKVYDHLSLPMMDLVAEALKHENWCQRLKAILDPLELWSYLMKKNQPMVMVMAMGMMTMLVVMVMSR